MHEGKEFRTYDVNSTDFIQERVRRTYYTMHTKQTVEFVEKKVRTYIIPTNTHQYFDIPPVSAYMKDSRKTYLSQSCALEFWIVNIFALFLTSETNSPILQFTNLKCCKMSKNKA